MNDYVRGRPLVTGNFVQHSNWNYNRLALKHMDWPMTSHRFSSCSSQHSNLWLASCFSSFCPTTSALGWPLKRSQVIQLPCLFIGQFLLRLCLFLALDLTYSATGPRAASGRSPTCLKYKITTYGACMLYFNNTLPHSHSVIVIPQHPRYHFTVFWLWSNRLSWW